jgi:hypothetical protein
MKIKAGTIVTRYNGKPVIVDQDLLPNGIPMEGTGRDMTVGDIFSTILSTKKVEQFNILKADVLARRFYRADIVDIDESDYGSLLEVIDHNDQFVPFVLAYARRALIEAREGEEKPDRKRK